jgi:hypothetical protein
MFKLRDLSSGALAAAAREFQMQSHLLMASTDLALREHFDAATVQRILSESWLAASWMAAERLQRAVDLGSGAAGVAAALRLTPMLPPGCVRDVAVDGDELSCTLRAIDPRLFDAAHPGWCGALAQGDSAAFEGTARSFGREATDVTITVDGAAAHAVMRLEPTRPDVAEPDAVALARIGLVGRWTFDLAR